MMIDDWEKRSEHTPLEVHMVGPLAGCFAGLIEHISMLPLDNIKTHLQVLPGSRFWGTFKQLKSHGLKTYFDGIGAVTAGCMPAHALYFGSYEFLKDFLQVNDEDVHPFHFAFIGASSTLWHDLIMTPFDVIKQRQQILESGFLATIKNLLKKEGLKSLYRSFPITYLMNVPFQAVFFASNETFRVLICTKENHTFASHFSAAALAGAVSVALINPLDVIKTKLQTQTCFNKENKIKYFNFVDTIKTIRVEEGLRGFYKGLVPRLCMQTLSGATAWASYEYIKKRLLKYSDLL